MSSAEGLGEIYKAEEGGFLVFCKFLRDLPQYKNIICVSVDCRFQNLCEEFHELN